MLWVILKYLVNTWVKAKKNILCFNFMAYIPPHRRNKETNPPKFAENNRRSFGIVPCQTINEKRFILLQISYSSTLHNFKIDPFRGERDEDGERPIEIAIRETKEESAHLLRFIEEDLRDLNPLRDRYFVHTQFGDGTLTTAQQMPLEYDHNRPRIIGDAAEVIETDGLYWLDIDTVNPERMNQFPRISYEVARLVKILKEYQWDIVMENDLLRMYRLQDDEGLFYYSSNELLPEEEQVDNDLADLMGNMEINDLETRLNNLETRLNEQLWDRRRQQIAEYPQDEPTMREVLSRYLSQTEIEQGLGIQ